MSIIDETITWAPTASPNGKAQSIHKTFDTANDTQATALEVALADQSTTDLCVKVMCRSAAGQRFGIDLRGTWAREGGSVSQLRNASDNALSGNPGGGWGATLAVDGTNARVRVTGPDGVARWSIVASTQVVAQTVAGDPLAIFGADLKGWLDEDYDEDTGIWIDESAEEVDTSQSNGAAPNKRPAEGTINGHPCAVFDGTDDGLDWGGDRELLTGDFTIAAVVQTSTIGTARMILSKLYSSSAFFLGASFYATTDKLAAGANDDVATAFAESDSTLADGNPHVVVGVRDGTTVKLYIDGDEQTDTGTHGTSAITNNSDRIGVGCSMYTSDSTTANHFNGKIGQVLMVSRKPTDPELTALHAYLTNWAGI